MTVSLDEVKSRLDTAEENFSELEVIATKTIKTEAKNKNKKLNRDTLTGWTKKYTWSKCFKFNETINLKIQDTQKTPKRINIKETQIGCIIIVPPETIYKEKKLKQLGQKEIQFIQTKITVIKELLSATLQARKYWNWIFKCMPIGEKKVKQSLLSDNMINYAENSKESTKYY